MASLDTEALSFASDILCTPLEEPCSALKLRLLSEFEVSLNRKVWTLLEDLELGDMSTSMLLRKMRELSEGYVADDF